MQRPRRPRAGTRTDGSIARLDAVIDHYAAGGRARSARTSPRLVAFHLDEGERADLIAFLESLTDEALLSDPRHGDPVAP